MNNSLSRLLKGFEGTGKLKDFAASIDWDEKTEIIVEGSRNTATNREVLYRELSQASLIELAHPNLVKGLYGSSPPPYEYCIKRNLFDFLKTYLTTYVAVYGPELRAHVIESSIRSVIKDTYTKYDERVELKDKASILAWYGRIENLIDFAEPYMIKMLGHVDELKETIAQKKAQSLYLIGAGPKVVLEDYMLEYAICNMDIANLIEEALPVLQDASVSHFLYGDTHLNYGCDQEYFNEKLLESADEFKCLMKNLELAAPKLIIDACIEGEVLEGLAEGCPVLFNFVERHFPAHQYSVGDKKYSASDIKNIYAVARMVQPAPRGESIDKKNLQFSENYTKRAAQYKKVGLTLPSMKSWAASSFPLNVEFGIFPGIESITDTIVREKLKLNIEISRALHVGKVHKI